MLRIERMGPDDWRRVRAVRLRALHDAPDAFWVTPAQEAAIPEASWRDRLGRDDAATFVAVDDGADVGIAVGAPHHVDPGDAGLYAMWVAPEARRRGVARALVERVVAWARAAGHPTVRLEVADGNDAAVRLYAALGFAPTGHSGTMPPPRQHIHEHERALDLAGG